VWAWQRRDQAKTASRPRHPSNPRVVGRRAGRPARRARCAGSARGRRRCWWRCDHECEGNQGVSSSSAAAGWTETMKEIKLTQNRVALVDDDDFDWLSQYKWAAHWERCTRSFYARRHFRIGPGKYGKLPMHRAILGLSFGDKRQVDHKDHNTLNNQRSNLRIVDCRQNHYNRIGVGGYRRRHDIGRYEAYIRVEGRQKCLGMFDTADDAHAAYLAAKCIYHQIPE